MSDRDLSKAERAIVETIARWLPKDEAESLLEDLHKAKVVSSCSTSSTLRFALEGYEQSEYRGQRAYSVEASTIDQDGADLSIIIFKDHNFRLFELEIIRWDDKEPISPDLFRMHPIVYVGDVVPLHKS